MSEVTKIWDKVIGVRLSWIILIVLLALCIYFGREYYHGKLEEHSTALYGGLVTSLIAVIIQMLMQWNEHREIEKFKKMGIFKILPNRDGKQDYYFRMLEVATKKINFLGSTSLSFLRDFGNLDVSAGNKASALKRALDRGVAVQILVVQRNMLEENKRAKFDEAKEKLELLRQLYPQNFTYSYLSHIPSHTLVMVDNQCIVGPIVPGISSDVTSAIHASIDSPFLTCFLKHFDSECKIAIQSN